MNIIIVGVALAVVCIIYRLSTWDITSIPRRDDMIDVMIRERGVQAPTQAMIAAGLDRADQAIFDRMGRERWEAMVAAQARMYPSPPLRLLAFPVEGER